MNKIPKGLCQCGCEQKTLIAKQSQTRTGAVKGESLRFVHGHNAKGDMHSNWKNGRVKSGKLGQYPAIRIPGHPKANSWGYVHEHILLAEKALGKALPNNAVVHHHTPEQLVICEDQYYHMLIELRTKAFKNCGHASWLQCVYCKKWDDPTNMWVWNNPTRTRAYHKKCRPSRARV